jgi:flagella basal body P-ring formation protein FlgA
MATMTTETQGLGRAASTVLVGFLTLAAGVLTLAARAQAPVASWQPPATIAAAARDAAAAAGAGEVEAVAVDDRLKLKVCATELEARITRPIQRGQGTVAVSCSGPTPWRLFVPVRTANEVPALVLARSVQPGDVLTAADITVAERSAATLPFDYMSAPEQAIGFAVRRSQAAGAVLVPAALESPTVVERGALVTVIAGVGPVTVKSEGVAIDSARLNERVKVRSASGRVIEGTAEAPGQVRVGS